MNLRDLVTWLKEGTDLSILTQEVLQNLAPKLEERICGANQTLVLANTPAVGLYILRSGATFNLYKPTYKQIGRWYSISFN
ncbi:MULTISPECIES: hypothetical protein [unclassified Moorena]|uniref:hypothetical protein n=1 Tax=unclassified Moorena TaxID=2683338 RepID=UPI0013B9E370|nr:MULTISPECIES: hypothetical protein [unclassified Moorena]NEP33422.1 hypothetical protein [Moorena sp. SIO3B2]NER88243.1 hypothetical protein [Moorena sp. SIO3A2]NES43597.1 hypothetical protein [Moorena sp. SIO2C4]